MRSSSIPTLPVEGYARGQDAVRLEPGAYVEKAGVIYRIDQVLNFDVVVGIEVETGRMAPLSAKELSPAGTSLELGERERCDIDAISDKEWSIATDRFEKIKPLLGGRRIGRKEVDARAKEVGVDAGTLYRWVNRYRDGQQVSSLIPLKRGWRDGNGRLPEAIESVIKNQIQTYYLTTKRPSVKEVIKAVNTDCDKAGLRRPGESAVRARVAKVSERERLRRQGYADRARNLFTPAAGKFPNADYPLAVVQADHTPADVMLVDDVHRKSIGRPWITLSMDVFSRMPTGYFISFDHPSKAHCGQCMAQSILPKDEALMLLGIDAEWPVWGTPKMLHTDNGADFRSESFKRAIMNYGISLAYRPVKRPNYGGHIERLMGTLMQQIKCLDGATFSNVRQKEGLDPEKSATMTMSEFERWFVRLLCKYMITKHEGIGMTPLRKWEIGVFGNEEIHGVGMQPRRNDSFTVYVDFLPSWDRQVLPTGVSIDGVNYYDDVLRGWINAKDPATGEKREFVFRRDPRDISKIYFYEPNEERYFEVRAADIMFPQISIWDYRKIDKKNKDAGNASAMPGKVRQLEEEMRTIESEASANTKKARRDQQRRTENKKKTANLKSQMTPVVEKLPEQSDFGGFSDGVIQAFGELG